MTLIIGPSYVSLSINVASTLTRNQTSVRAKQAKKRSQAQSPPAASVSQELKMASANWSTPMFLVITTVMTTITSGETYPGEDGPST
jgi:hypothetical protein